MFDITSSRFRLLLLLGLWVASIHGMAQNGSAQLPSPSNCSAAPEAIIITQADSSQITILGKGDMNNHWTETVDGYTIVRNHNGIYEYAKKTNGQLQAGGTKANDPLNRNQAEINYLKGVTKHMQADLNPLKTSILNQVNAGLRTKSMPTSGTIRVLALLIDYPDLVSTYTLNDFDSVLTDTTNNSVHGSFKTYYRHASGNQLEINVDVMGWYRADSNFIYYGRDSGFARAADLVREAVDAAEVAGANFANYDNDNDGNVDGILAVHAGQGAEQGSQTQFIWSHRWVLRGGNSGSVTYDGKVIDDYIINPEVTLVGGTSRLVGIGVFAHEFGHNLGLPDLYDTDQTNGDSRGIGTWGVMAIGTWLGIGYTPGDFCAWSKEELGWINPQLLTIGNSGNYSLQPTSRNVHQIFRINTSLSNEYFLLENRQKLGLDTALRGNGLAIWHINTNKTNSFGNNVNADHRLKGVDLEEADGLAELDSNSNSGNSGDLYPGSTNNTSFDDSTNPDAKHYTLASSGIIIRNIQEIGDLIHFGFGQAPGAPCNGFTTLTDSSGSFDDGSDTLDYAHNQNCSWLIQPASGTITLSFSAFNTQAGVDTLNVYDGIDSTAALLGSFSGNSIPAPLTSSGNALFVQFISDSTISFAGWTANYVNNTASGSACGNDTLTASTGTFDDGTDSSKNYAANTNCSWLIEPSGASQIDLTFNRFETQANFDILRVYNGSSSTAPLLGTFSGSSLPAQLTANSGKMFLEFTTDGNTELNGWEVSYNSSTTPTLSVSPDSIFLQDTLNSSAIYNITSNAHWVNRDSAAWFVQSPDSANGNSTVTVTATQANTNANRRFANAYIQVFGSLLLDTVVVVQEGKPFVSASPDSLFFSGVGSVGQIVNVNSNVSWSVTSSMPWIAANPNSGNLNESITIDVQDNMGSSVRQGMVIISGTAAAGNDTVMVVQDTNLFNPNLSVSPDSIILGQANGSSGSFTVNSNTIWTTQSGATWLSVNNPALSRDTNTVQIVANSANPASTARRTFIAVQDVNGSLFDTVFVEQMRGSLTLSVSPSNLALAQPLGSTDSFTVFSNTSWQLLSGAPWLTVSGPANQKDTNTVNITANSANNTNNLRSTFVAVQDLSGTVFDSVMVQQFGNNLTLEANPDSLFLAATGGNLGNIQISSNTIWSISSNVAWLDIQPKSGSGNASINVITNGINTDPNLRFAEIMIEDSINNLADTVVVVQDTLSGELTLAPDTIRLSSTSGSLARFDVLTQSAWNATANASWLSVTPTGSTGNLSATAIANFENTSNSERIGSILVTTSGDQDSVIVIQAGMQSQLDVSPSEINLNFVSGSNDVILVQSNIDWKVTNPVNWLSINPDSGNGNANLNVTANSVNNSGAIRTATVTLSGDGVADQKVTVNQIDGTTPTFTVSRDTVYLDQPQGSISGFTVLSNVMSWKLVENTPWFLINPTSGSNTENIEILAASRNVFGNPRSGEITASTDSFPDKVVTVIQRSANPIFQISPTILTLGPNIDDSVEFNLSSNLTFWEISENASWMETNPKSGSLTNTVSIRAIENNNSGNIRSEIITVNAPPLVPQSILVTQDTSRLTSIQSFTEKEGQSALIFPNPSQGLFNLVLTKPIQLSKLNLNLFSILGSQVNFKFNQLSDREFQLDLSGNKEGIYFLRMEFEGDMIMKKISLVR